MANYALLETLFEPKEFSWNCIVLNLFWTSVGMEFFYVQFHIYSSYTRFTEKDFVWGKNQRHNANFSDNFF